MKHELDKGSNVIHIALDETTRWGKNAEPITEESLKKGGVSLTTLQDIYEALTGMDIGAHSIYIHTGESSVSLVAMVCAMLQANGEKKNKLHGIIGADPIGVLVEEGRLSISWDTLYSEMAELIESEHGEKLKVFLCNMDHIPQHKPRAEFSTGFFEVGGFEVLKNDGFMTTQEAAKAAVDSGAFAAIICSTDDTYPELVPPTVKQIKAAKPDMIVMVAGMPAPEFEQLYKDSGVEEFIHVRANCLQVLTWMQTKGGIK